MEKLVSERRATVSYRMGNIFRKYYKYAQKARVLQEGKNALYIYKKGIHTPMPIKSGYDPIRRMYFNDFVYHDIRSINPNDVTAGQIAEVRKLADGMPRGNDNGAFWHKKYVPSLCSAFCYLRGVSEGRIMTARSILDRQVSDTFIHGDFSFDNIGRDLVRDSYIIYDFEDSGYGAPGWDYAYLLGCLPWTLTKELDVGREIEELIRAVALVRYGRGLRKSFEVEERKDNYEYWWRNG